MLQKAHLLRSQGSQCEGERVVVGWGGGVLRSSFFVQGWAAVALTLPRQGGAC